VLLSTLFSKPLSVLYKANARCGGHVSPSVICLWLIPAPNPLKTF
jgi:hypothetical protein